MLEHGQRMQLAGLARRRERRECLHTHAVRLARSPHPATITEQHLDGACVGLKGRGERPTGRNYARPLAAQHVVGVLHSMCHTRAARLSRNHAVGAGEVRRVFV